MVIINGKVYTMEQDMIPCGYVRIKGKCIEAVGDMHSFSLQKEDGQVLDVKGAWVLPGLIEAHCHIGITEEKWGIIADDSNEQTNPSTASLRALDAVNPMDPAFHAAIAAGITSVMVGPGSANPIGGQFMVIKTQGRCIDKMVIKQPAALKVAFGENPKTAYGDCGQFPSTRMGTASLIRKVLQQAVEYKKQKESGELSAIDMELEPWIPVLNKEIPLKAHAHRADDILTAIRIAKEYDVNITIDHGTEGHLIADEIKESGFPVISGPQLASRSKLEVQNMDFKSNKTLYDKGIMFAITTDHPVTLIQYLPLCAGMAVKKGIPLDAGLKAITIHAAKICGVDDRIGSLKKGKDADLAIYSGNPMEVLTETLYTIIDGEIIYQKEDDFNH